ncbi:hypothetical protein UFOVP1015_34 [uncultured Caudovirales phage]|uniref:Uncharacterized protein n=1 Tax=uncultured Caudovirales phage TaxID=2100421 RepID=A0A6J5Q3T7_9CAUD|nr:hypothetical protein UFOVP1015_34 [uncultured Caudovirales phage]
MTTELFITTPRLGTIAVDGTVNITGTGTYFTADDVGKSIIIRTTAGDKRSVVATYVSATSITVATAIDTTQSGCYFYIDYQTADLYEDFPYSLNYAIADIRNPESRNSSFSKTIKLPGSKANNIIFDNIFEIDLEGSFNPNIRAFIIVYSNYIPVFNGNLQLLRINREQDKIEYEVSIFGKIGDLFQKIADKLLTDLDLSDLDQTGTAAQITGSWAGGADLFYPLLANGRQIFSTATPQYISDQIAPAIKVSRIFEDILSSVGYTCADTATLYSATGMDKLYIPCLKEWKRRVQINASFNADLFTPVGVQWELVIERARTGSTEIIIIDNFGSATSMPQTYSTQLELDYGDVVYMQVQIYQAGGSMVWSQIPFPYSNFLEVISLDNQYSYNPPIAFKVATTATSPVIFAPATVRIPYDNNSTGGMYDTYNSFNTGTYECIIPAKNTAGFLPDNYKQRDFLLALIKMFNLYLEPVFDNETQINILPRDTYYSQGSIVDWTEKLDVGQNIELVPMGELDWKEYLFSWKPDEDFFNKDYKNKTFETYGQRTVIVENDFIATKKKVECEIAPLPLSGSGYHDLVLPICIKDGITTAPNTYTGIMRIIYFDGEMVTTGATNTVYLDGVSHGTYPFCGHLVGTPQLPTFDYNWAAPRYLYYTMTDPTLYPYTENLYTSFWQNFIEEISDKYSKLYIAYFNLTSEDIRTLDFRNSFFINGSYFRLNRVIDYSPIGNTLTKCELIRIRDAVYIGESSIVNHGQTEVSNTGGVHEPYISTSMEAGQIVVADSLGNGKAQTMGGDATIDNAARVSVVAIQGRSVQDAAPSDGDTLVWVAANSRYEPQAGGGGTGDVVGPASAVDNNIATFDGTTGKLIQDGGTTIADINTNAVDRITVKLAESITKGQAVYISSANGTNIIVSKASNLTEATSSKTLGLLETSGATNAIVNVVTSGLLDGLNTSTATIGDPVWLGTSGNLIYGLASKPFAPAHLVYIGVVSRVSATVGEILVKVQNGFELKEIHDVSAQTPTDKDVLQYESATTLWKNKALTTASVAASTDKNYVSDAKLIVVNNTSGTNTGDQDLSSLAPKASPTFTGTPAAPTPSANDNSTKVATTAYVENAFAVVAVSENVIRTYQALGSNIIAEACGFPYGKITTSATALTDGQITFIALDYFQTARTVTGVLWYQSVLGNYTADNNNKIGLFSYSGGTLTLVASCANDGTLWKTFASNTVGSKAFSSPYSAAAGQYFVGYIYNQNTQITQPQLAGKANLLSTVVQTFNFTNSAKLVGFVSGQTDFPATQAMSGVTALINDIWIGVY